MRRSFAAVTILLCVIGFGFVAHSQTAARAAASPTLILSRDAAPPLLGFVIVSGPHRGQFNPCNSSDYLEIAGQRLTKSGTPCPPFLQPGQWQQQAPVLSQAQSPAPGNILDPRWLSNDKIVNAGELARILKDAKISSRFFAIARKTQGNAVSIERAFPGLYAASRAGGT